MADSDEKKQNPADIMEYRILGNTGLKVSCLGLGMMTLDSEDQAIELISTVRKYGINFFDNAELYGRPCGTGEKLFGSALKKLQEKDPKLYRRSELVITTKLFFGCGDGNQPNTKNRKYAPNELGLSRKHLIEGINESLERLQLDYVDIIYAHTVDALTPTEEIVMGFTDIIRNGKAFYWGTSGWPAQKITEAYWIAKINNWIPPVVEQPPYNMFNRTQVEKNLLPMFYAPYKIGTTIWGPLDAGILTGKYVKEVPKDSRLGDGNSLGKWWGGKNYAQAAKNEKVVKLMEIAKDLDISMVSLAIGWVLKNKNVSCCMLGGSKASQLEQNVEAIGAAKKINKDVLKKIEDILGNKPQGSRWQTFRTVEYKTNPL